MKLKTRHKISCAMLLISAVIAMILAVLPLEEIMTGYKVINGVEDVTDVPKIQGLVSMIVVPVVCGILWHLVGKWNDKRIAEEPELKSYRLHSVLIAVPFLVWMFLPIGFGIANIVLWIQSLL